MVQTVGWSERSGDARTSRLDWSVIRLIAWGATGALLVLATPPPPLDQPPPLTLPAAVQTLGTAVQAVLEASASEGAETTSDPADTAALDHAWTALAAVDEQIRTQIDLTASHHLSLVSAVPASLGETQPELTLLRFALAQTQRALEARDTTALGRAQALLDAVHR